MGGKSLALIIVLVLHICRAAIYLPCEESEAEDFCDCWNLQDPILVCSSRGLTSIPAITKAHSLDLSSNNITEIKQDVLPPETGIQELIISNNKIDKIHRRGFRNVDATLVILDLSGNEITSVPLSFSNGRRWPKLSKLVLSNNYIGNIDKNAFAGMNNLTHLNLENNPITKFSPGSWYGLNSLYGLMISPGGNDIRWIPTKNIEYISSLTLSNGRPQQLSYLKPWFSSFHKLKELALVGMGLDDKHFRRATFPSSWKPHLRKLTISHNLFKDVPWGLVNFASTLEELDLSGNFIETISAYISFPRTLKRLNVSNNDLTRFSAKTILKLNQAKSIDMSRNHLKGLAWNVTQIDQSFPPDMTLYIGNNNWACVCGFPWFKIMMHRQVIARNGHLTLDEINNSIKCGTRGNHEGQLIKDVPTNVFLCPGVKVSRYLWRSID